MFSTGFITTLLYRHFPLQMGLMEVKIKELSHYIFVVLLFDYLSGLSLTYVSKGFHEVILQLQETHIMIKKA